MELHARGICITDGGIIVILVVAILILSALAFCEYKARKTIKEVYIPIHADDCECDKCLDLDEM